MKETGRPGPKQWQSLGKEGLKGNTPDVPPSNFVTPQEAALHRENYLKTSKGEENKPALPPAIPFGSRKRR